MKNIYLQFVTILVKTKINKTVKKELDKFLN